MSLDSPVIVPTVAGTEIFLQPPVTTPAGITVPTISPTQIVQPTQMPTIQPTLTQPPTLATRPVWQ